MDNSKNRQSDHLGVNKYGKNIRKSPLHQPNFNNNAPRPQPPPQPQPQVYNISKNDFRNIVQKLTGSPSQEPLPRPPQNPPKSQSMRLQRIRPPPLTPFHRPPVIPPPAPVHQVGPPPVPHNNSLNRPAQFGPPSPSPAPAPMQPVTSGNSVWSYMAESPISAYMRFLQNSLLGPSPRLNQAQSQLPPQPQVPGQFTQPPSSGLLPNPSMPALPSPRMSGPVPPMHNIPSSQANGPAFVPSPTSQFLLPSPTGYMNLLSPHSPYPLLSPGIQYPPQLSPTFAFSMAQSGILGPGPQHPPPSPGLGFPSSPSWFFPISSPSPPSWFS